MSQFKQIKGDTMTRTYFTILFLTAGFLPFGSMAQTRRAQPSVAQEVSLDQSIARAAIIHPAPPVGFNLETAREEDLAYYGLPPRPAIGSPQYDEWLRLTSMERVTPTLEQTNIMHGPVQNTAGPCTAPCLTSSNWSGFVVQGPNGTFKLNSNLIESRWTVPIAQQAFGTCDGTNWHESQWVGFDGAFGSADLLQAGTEANALCSNNVTTTFYSFWYEWVPFAEVRVALPVTAGDLVVIEVWYTTAAPYGHTFLANLSTNQSTTVSFNPPAGTAFVGNSAEWILERPTVGGALTDLTNYVGMVFSANMVRRSNGQTCYPTAGHCFTGVATTSHPLVMTCPTWSPTANCPAGQVISNSDVFGPATLWFWNSGPSLGNGKLE
jgi:hypothetical protein